MKDKLNIVIVGGGSTWCPGILKALTKHMDILPLNRVMLYDIDAERQRPIGEFGKILFAEADTPWLKHRDCSPTGARPPHTM